MKLAFILLILVSFFTVACEKKCHNNPHINYDFETPATLFPAKDTFHIGDTLYLSSNFSDEVKERNTGNTFKLENFYFYPIVGIYKIDLPLADLTSINTAFDVIVDTAANFAYESEAIGFEYLYEGGNYHFSARIIPKAAGTFFLEIGASLHIDRYQSFPERCPEKGLDSHTVMNRGSDTNLYLLSTSPDPHYNTWIIADIEKRAKKFGAYCFVVTE